MKENFLLFIDEVASKISEYVDNNKSFLLVSKKNVDGISAATLLLNYLYNNNVQFHFTTLNDTKTFLKNINEYPEDVIILVDFGSEFIGTLKDIKNKDIIVIDHHYLSTKDRYIDGITQLNPEIFGINGYRDVCSSTIVYYLLRSLNFDFYEIEYFPIIGVLGDYQELSGINKEVLENLINKGIIEVKESISIFGPFSRPLYKALELSDIIIPSITGNEKNSIELLKSLGIPVKKNKDFTYYQDLSDKEKEKLAREIIRLRKEKSIIKSDKIFTKVYLAKNETYLRDLLEMTYLFRAMCYTNDFSEIILSALSKKIDNYYYEHLITYKNKLSKIISTIFERRVKIVEEGQIVTIYIKVPSIMLENACEIIMNNSWFPGNRIIMCVSEGEKNITISARHTSQSYLKDLHKTIIQASMKVDGYLDPYSSWSTVVIPKDKFNEFMTNFKIFAKQNSIII